MSRRRPSRNELDKKLAEIRAKISSYASRLPDDPKSKKERIERAKRDKDFFCRTYLPHYFTLPAAGFHIEIMDMLDIREKPVLPVVIAAPRGHGKSTTVTLAYPLQQICYKLRNFIILGGPDEQLAAEYVQFIKLELEENERIKQDFGELKGVPWSDTEIVTANGVKVLARGAGQKIRGQRHRQFRPDLAIWDDLEDDKLVKNPKRVKGLMDWLKRAVYPGLEPGGSLFVIGTILAKKSMLQQLLDDENWHGKKYQAITKEGKPLWAGRFSLKDLERIKLLVGSVAFAQEYMNNPKDEEGLFREEWFRYYHPSELTGRILEVFSFIDPSVEAKASSDYKAIITVGVDPKLLLYFVLDAFVRKATIDQMVRVAYSRHREFKPIHVGLESNGYQKLLVRDFDRMARELGQYLPIKLINHSVSKESRIARISPLVERGKVLFRKGHSDQDLLVEQTLYFPDYPNDDAPDALEGAIDIAETCMGGGVEYDQVEERRFGEMSEGAW